jgi:arylsulfatase A-like enzyme
LAAESFLFDFALTDSPRLEVVYRSYWQGLHALSLAAGNDDLPSRLQGAGYDTTLLTDDPQVADFPGADSYQQRLFVPLVKPSAAAAEVDQTHFAQIFSAAIEALQPARTPSLLWIHAQGLHGPWDAPLEFRNQFAEEDDPLPPEFVVPPRKRLVKPYQPDEVLGVTHAYAGQVALLDLCLGAFLDALAALDDATQPLLIVTAPRGYPLAEHGLIGHVEESLHGEALNVPCLIRFPDQAHAAHRIRDLIQPPDLFATLLDWTQTPAEDSRFWGQSLLPLVRGEQQPAHDRAVASVANKQAIRTPAWSLLRHPDGVRELYAKPDDRWEVNQISTRCESIADELERALDEFQQTVQTGGPADLAPLPESLTTRFL